MVNKQYYQIGQVCEQTGLNHSTIRFWEEKLSLIRPARSSGGHRYYSSEQLELILYLKHLLYDEKYTIDGAKKRIEQERKALKNSKKIKTADKINDNPVTNSLSNEQLLAIKKELQNILDLIK